MRYEITTAVEVEALHAVSAEKTLVALFEAEKDFIDEYCVLNVRELITPRQEAERLYWDATYGMDGKQNRLIDLLTNAIEVERELSDD